LKREHRKEIKQDEFAAWLERTYGWVTSHRDEVRIGVGLGVVLLAAFGALGYFQSQRAHEARRAFQDAMAAYEAPVASELAPGADRPSGQVFATAEDKYKTAAAAFEGVVRRYGSLDVAVRAQYYGALCRIQLGQYAEAERSLHELLQRDVRPRLMGDLARMALAELYRKSGQTDKAVETYRQVISDPDTTLPRDYALHALAETLEDARRFKEARAAFEELLRDYPGSVYAADARTRAAYLGTPGQG
jgi:tetratricopeptide (TPR) repeat protein